jgi:hypothetical protein
MLCAGCGDEDENLGVVILAAEIVIASEAIHRVAIQSVGLLRRTAPRYDG